MQAADPQQNPSREPRLRMRGVCKAFPGVRALDDAQLTVNAGEVHALMGENGAGKSTLMKVLAGAVRTDDGSIEIDGRIHRFESPIEAEHAGVAVIYQEFNLVPALSVRENIFLANAGASSAGVIDAKQERRLARELLARLGSDIDPDSRIDRLSVAEQQIVEIAKALSQDAQIIVMDEPTASLTGEETRKLFDVINDLRSRGISIIYVSHRLDEIFEISDRITVMRDGKFIDDRPIGEVDRETLIELMVGRALENEFPSRAATLRDELLEVDQLQLAGVVGPVSFRLRRGEILGITGLVGAGRTELLRLLFGADRATSGEVRLGGRTLALRNPREAIAAGICLLTEDRKSQGLVLKRSVLENFGLPNLRTFSRATVIEAARERGAYNAHKDSMRIKSSSHAQLAGQLSGGNQQKVILAKWLERRSDVVMFDEPTRGIDVGARFEIYQLMHRLTDEGKAIIMVSSELPEVLGMSDRILVMRDGRIAGEIDKVATATQEDIMRLAMGVEFVAEGAASA